MRLNNNFLLICIGICVVVSVALCSYIYQVTKESYLNVGFNNGYIQANYDIMKKIQQVENVESCDFNDETIQYTEVLRAKAESIYLFKLKDDNMQFCQ